MKEVQQALSPIGIPAFSGAWKPTVAHATAPDQYLVYTTMATEDEHWDDAPSRYLVYVYLNLWSKPDPTSAIHQVRLAMRQAGFQLVEESDSYNDDTGQTLIAWTWVLWTEMEDEVAP